MSPAARRRLTTIVTALGLILLFVCAFTLPPALVHLGRAAAEVGTEPLTARSTVTVVVGFGTLVLGGVLTIVGVVLRRTAAAPHNPEDDEVDRWFTDEDVVSDYDPVRLNPRLRHRR